MSFAWTRALPTFRRSRRSPPNIRSANVPTSSYMRALYASGRQADALAAYRRYAGRLADELGLEPSAAMQELQLRILRHNVAPPTPLRAMKVSHVSAGDRRIAMATVGSGQPLIALPGWVSNIDVIIAGRDPRSSMFQRLVRTHALVIYDRYGTGRSPGPVDDFGLDASVAELAAVATRAGAPVDLLAMSQAGPVAVTLAATRPDLVRRLVFFGTYASAAEVFIRPDLNATLIALVRSHWGLGSKLLAGLYRPDLTDAAADHMTAVLRDSADRDVAAGYLEAIYAADVTALLAGGERTRTRTALPRRPRNTPPRRAATGRRPARRPAGHPRRALPPTRHSRPRPNCRHHHRVPVRTAQVATVLPIAQPVAPESGPAHRSLAVACQADLARADLAGTDLGRCTAVDYFPELLEDGGRRTAAESLDVEFQLGDAEDLPAATRHSAPC